MTMIDNVSNFFTYPDVSEHSILTYFDIDVQWSEDKIHAYLNEILINHPILKQTITKNHSCLRDIHPFDINQCLTIKYARQSSFPKYIRPILNTPFTEYKFMMYVLIDTHNDKSRVYFKIHHAYADGYKLIQLLTSPFLPTKYKQPLFKRKTNFFNSIYYWIVGTLTLMISTFVACFKCMFTHTPQTTEAIPEDTSTDYIICKLDFNVIKTFVKQHNITVNDFLYTLMVKTDTFYTNQSNVIGILCPVNISQLNKLNNMGLILSSFDTSLDNKTMFKTVHTLFNHYKYSWFIHFLSLSIKIISYLNLHKVFTFLYQRMMHTNFYMYSNMIGPSLENVNLPITDIHFLTTATNTCITYNMISCKDKINLICTFQKNRINDKTRFKKCIHKAYQNLLSTYKSI